MSDSDFKEIFSKRLRYYLDLNDMTQHELSKKLGVGTTSVSNWCKGIKTPRMDKVDAMCSIFRCRRRDLMEDPPEEPAAESDGDILDKQILDIFKELPDDKKSAALDYLNYLKGTNK